MCISRWIPVVSSWILTSRTRPHKRLTWRRLAGSNESAADAPEVVSDRGHHFSYSLPSRRRRRPKRPCPDVFRRTQTGIGSHVYCQPERNRFRVRVILGSVGILQKV